MAKISQNSKIRISYFLVALLFGCIGIAIIVKALYISVIEGDRWREVGKTTRKPQEVIAQRGNIYSHDGQLMATTEYVYRLYIDFWADGLKKDTLKKYIDPLSEELAKMFPEKSAAQYRSHIMAGWNIRVNEEAKIKSEKKDVQKSREYKLFENNRLVSYVDLKEIKKLPFLRQSKYKSGLISKQFVKRTKPFGTLASRTIGDIYGEFKKGGKNGLELEYDSLLRGVPGTSVRRKLYGRMMDVIDVDPIPGKDIISTIDVIIQDITENALLDKLREINANWGTAIVMEVRTGEIKAITNLGRTSRGDWSEEKWNYALAARQPGSTFKVASMMVALEDGVVSPKDTVNAEPFLHGPKVIADGKNNYGKISAEQVIWRSSNPGMARIILKGYANKPGKYIEGLYRIGLNEDLKLEIPGAAKPYIPKNVEPARTSYGYSVKISPIYMLAFFNAIANDGKMISPIFVKEIQQNGKTVERKKTKVVRDKICSDKTLSQIREMLYDVVHEKNGTGKNARSSFVEISGKTATAEIQEAGESGNRSAFCGYFPSKEPLYSFIVVISDNSQIYGGTACAPVAKAIAEGIVSRSMAQKVEDCPKDSLTPLSPKVKVNLKDRKVISNLVPNVVGMGAKDAVYLLENAGLKVNLTGKGTVVSQTITPGTGAVKGQTIGIQLR